MFRHFFTLVLDSIFPPSKMELLVRHATQEQLHAHALQNSVFETRTIFEYRDPLVRALIWQTKYSDNMSAATLLGNALREELLTSITTPYVVIPMPLSSQRLRERGYNQTERIAEIAVLDLPFLTYEPSVLVRKNTESTQTKLTKKQREENIAGAFYVKNTEILKKKKVILIDDVVTTGATLREAARALKRAGAKSVLCVALAH